jgi:hypothetical protein
MESSAAFLNAHPELLRARERSAVWESLMKSYAVEALGPDAFLVRGDTIGNREDLFVDALARGSSPHSPDPLARRLFEELTPDLRSLVLRELRKTEVEEDG